MAGRGGGGSEPRTIFLDMFRNEWRLARGDVPLHSVAIVDEQPEAQYLYPEFLLVQRMFERAGIAAYIADPSVLQSRGNGLYLGEIKIDLVYNRLTDFSLQQHPVLRQAYLEGGVVLTPGPRHYAQYADKRNLVRLTDARALRALGASETDIATLQAGVPQTRLVEAADQERWWQERKQWFFKPAEGYGSKGSYSGAKLTRRVSDEIMQGGYVAQRMAAPGARMVCAEGRSRSRSNTTCAATFMKGGCNCLRHGFIRGKPPTSARLAAASRRCVWWGRMRRARVAQYFDVKQH